MIILIPAYQPDQQLPGLIRSIRSHDPAVPIVVVDDGSGPDYKETFDGVRALGCHVIGYSRNRGKGFALKTGFGFVLDHLPDHDVVCADSDGQHGAADIFKVAARLRCNRPDSWGQATMVLGSRDFSGNVPARSKIGNTATKALFALATGERLPDTQTGLRGYPAQMLPWLQGVRGDRYEFELNVLLEARDGGYAIDSVGIATVYLDHNSGSHFRPVLDSVRIYAPLLTFLASSFTAFLLDTVIFVLLTFLVDSLLLAVLGARAVSSAVNFMVNRSLVFRHGKDRPAHTTGVRYFALAAVLLAANYGLVLAFDAWGIQALPAKILVEVALLAVSFTVQHRFLFRPATALVPGRTPSSVLGAASDAEPASTQISGWAPSQQPHSMPRHR